MTHTDSRFEERIRNSETYVQRLRRLPSHTTQWDNPPNKDFLVNHALRARLETMLERIKSEAQDSICED
jgi:hypothetical protein